MGDNLQWLFGAFGAGWIIHMLYLLSLSSRQKKVLRQIEDVQKLLPDDAPAERK
jgi:CcmD family protein